MAIKKTTRPANGKTNKKGKLRVDFTDVETRVLIPEGDYHVKVAEVTLEESSNGNDYLNWVFAIMDEDSKINGQKLFYTTSLLPQALWNLRNLLETLGVETPNGPLDLELDEYKDLEAMTTVEHETYEGKKRAKPTSFEPLTDVAEADEDGPAEDEEEESDDDESEDTDAEEGEETEEDEDKLTVDEVKAMKIDELKDLAKKHKLAIKNPSPMPKKYRAQVMDALEAQELIAS